MNLKPDSVGNRSAPIPRNSRLHPAWILTTALAIISILLLAVSLLLWRANRSFSTAWQQEQRAKTSPAPSPGPAAPAVSAEQARLFFPEHRSRGAGPTAAISLAADPPRLVELRFEAPAGVPATTRWTVSISGSAGEAVRQQGLPVQSVGGISWVRIYVDTGSLLPGNYRVALSRDEAANAGDEKQWLLTVTR